MGRNQAEDLLTTYEPSSSVVVVSPHMDDAVLSAWSVLTKPQPVTVINVFTEIPPAGFVTRYDRIAGGDESAALVQQRLIEDREALALAGREPRNLDFLDDQYRDGEPDREAIASELEALVPEASMVALPAGLGGHVDHVLVRNIGIELATPGLQIVLYAELPYAVRYGWPHWVTRSSLDPHLDPDAEWEHYLPQLRGTLQSRAHAFSDEESDEKLTAMRTYRTQFPSLNAGVIDRLANPEIRRHEVFWDIDLAHG